jgi:hypothetical protein
MRSGSTTLSKREKSTYTCNGIASVTTYNILFRILCGLKRGTPPSLGRSRCRPPEIFPPHHPPAAPGAGWSPWPRPPPGLSPPWTK